MTTDPTPDLPPLLGVGQAAAVLGITGRAVLFRIQAGTLAATKLGTGKAAWAITRAEITKALAADNAARATKEEEA